MLNDRLISGVVAGPRTEAQWDGYAKALDCKITKEDEAFIDSLVTPGHPAAPGYNDPAYPIEGRPTWIGRCIRSCPRKRASRPKNWVPAFAGTSGSGDLMQGHSTIDEAEVARFSALARSGGTRAARWRCCTSSIRCGSPTSAMRPASVTGASAKQLDCLKGLRILDIGCGGGILCEPLARLGANVVGADPSEKNIAAARLHAEEGELAIDYRVTTAEALADAGERFDIVLAMEVVEHVADVKLFVSRCAEMVQPGGLMIAATINRTLKSFALAIVGAEYVLRWLPRGTHSWDKFVTPDELEIAMELGGLRTTDERGVIYNLLADRWELSADSDVNYMVLGEKPA